MFPIRSDCDYESHVPVAGFQWAGIAELQQQAKKHLVSGGLGKPLKAVHAVGHMIERTTGDWSPEDPGQVLVEKNFFDDEAEKRWVRPDAEPLLFRVFGELDCANLSSISDFASQYGPLGHQFEVSLIFLNRDPKDFDSIHVDMFVEDTLLWVRNILAMRTAVSVFDNLITSNVAGVRQFIQWKEGIAADEKQTRPETRNKRYRDLLPTEGRWWCDSHQGHSPEESILGRLCHSISFPQATKHDDPLRVGWHWLAREINGQLIGVASPRLELDESGKGVIERLAPSNLLAALWSQFYHAVGGNKGGRKCRACQKWFEISSDESGSTVRRYYCDDTCRVRFARMKRASVYAMRDAGRTPKQIAAELETDIDTVKKWLKDRPS